MHSFQYLPRAGGWAGGEAGGLETPARRGQAAGSSGEQSHVGVSGGRPLELSPSPPLSSCSKPCEGLA